jgi:hypothetical protein
MSSAPPEDRNGLSFTRKHNADERRQIMDQLSVLLERIEQWHAKTSQPLPVRRGSLLDVADALSEPFQSSHKIKQHLTNATDHLHALRALFVDARAQHLYAPYTLIRPALENAIAVLFIFRYATPRSVARETLRDEWANITEMHRAAITIGVPKHIADAEKLQRADLIDAAIEQAGFRLNEVKGKAKSTSGKMDEVTEAYKLSRMPYSMWQMCSAASHGMRWALPMLAMFDAEDDGESKTLSGRIMSDEASILNALVSACHVLDRAFTVFEAHSRPTGHTGQSFLGAQRR